MNNSYPMYLYIYLKSGEVLRYCVDSFCVEMKLFRSVLEFSVRGFGCEHLYHWYLCDILAFSVFPFPAKWIEKRYSEELIIF